jgi:hypothetical protein
MARFWTRIFALAFGMGVVSGVVLSYQLGTNFSRFSDATANVLGPLLGYEVLTTFFLQAGFLGIMLFGWDRVGRGLHLFATFMVAIGTLISAFWILAANSWMQTPAGHRFENGRFFVESWWEVIFNPSFPYRFAHMTMASFVTAAFVVAAVSAWQLLRGREPETARLGLSVGIGLAAILAPLQIFVGDMHVLNVQEHQPVKVAAMEGLWETRTHAPLLLFAIPDQAAERNRLEIGIPGLASLILQHDVSGTVRGLKDVPPENRPYVFQVFWAFRIMVGIGFAMLGLAWCYGVVVGLARAGPLAALDVRADGGQRFRCRPVGLVGRRVGTAALGRLRPDAHGRCGFTGRRRRGPVLVDRVCRRLCHAVRCVALLHREGHRRGHGCAPARCRGPAAPEGRVMPDLPLIWGGVIAFAIFMYVALDGFDLGVGILFPVMRRKVDRDVMMNSIAPVWDGKETWLVLGGGGLFAAFPAAYATLLPAFYLPIIVMLLALVFRGVAFEMRFKAERSRVLWDAAFCIGSTLAAFA